MKLEDDIALEGPYDCPLVHRPYQAETVEEKLFNKLWMQDIHGLQLSENVPVFGLLGRLLPEQEELWELLPGLLALEGQIILLGEGSPEQLRRFSALNTRFPGQMSRRPCTGSAAAELLSSGDFLLLGRWDRAWGLAAMAYGMLPVVLDPAGTRDLPEGLCLFPRQGKIPETVRGLYRDREAWERTRRRCMDFAGPLL